MSDHIQNKDTETDYANFARRMEISSLTITYMLLNYHNLNQKIHKTLESPDRYTRMNKNDLIKIIGHKKMFIKKEYQCNFPHWDFPVTAQNNSMIKYQKKKWNSSKFNQSDEYLEQFFVIVCDLG